MTELLLLAVVFLLVLVNGCFVAAEIAIVRARPSKLQHLSEEGDRGAERALHQIGHVDEYVATSQVGITLASLAIGFLGEPAIASLLEPVLEGPLGHAASLVISLVIAYMIVTLLHVILGEQAPKMVGIARGEELLLRISGSLDFFRSAFKPL